MSSAQSAPSASSVSAEEPVGRSLADGSTAQLKDLPSRRPPREPESRARGGAPRGLDVRGRLRATWRGRWRAPSLAIVQRGTRPYALTGRPRARVVPVWFQRLDRAVNPHRSRAQRFPRTSAVGAASVRTIGLCEAVASDGRKTDDCLLCMQEVARQSRMGQRERRRRGK